MNRTGIFLLLGIVLSGCAGTGSIPEKVRFDGVYRSQFSETRYGPAYDYLRFYPSGRVISSSLVGTPEEFWVSSFKANPFQSQGEYQIKSGIINIQTKSQQAKVDYSGAIVSEITLELQIYSKTTGITDARYYVFMKIDPAQLPDWLKLRTMKVLKNGDTKLEDVPVK